MAILYQILFNIYIIFISLSILKTNSKEISIRNNDDNFINLQNIINENQSDNELVIKFEDDYYDMSKLTFAVELIVNTNIKLIGKNNGTTFDFNNDKKGKLTFSFLRNRGEIVQLININFINFFSEELVGVQLITVISNFYNFQFIVNNCNFQDNHYVIFHFKIYCSKLSSTDTQFLITNKRIFQISHEHEKEYYDINEILKMKISNCKFVNNKGIIFSHSSTITLDNCYFSKLEKSTYSHYDIVLYNSAGSSPSLKITNSVFEDIYIKSKSPLINCEGLKLEIYNTTYRNCQSDYDYLFNVYNQDKNKEYIKIDNSIFQNTSTVIHGNHIKCEISNSIADSKYSIFTISNAEFNNLNITNALFGEESKYTLENIKLNTIKTNSKALLYFIYNNIEINNIDAENIKCLGDGSDTSFILFDSGEIKKRLSINNLYAHNISSNGPLIKIIGNNNEFNMENSEINNIFSFGSVIDNLSEKSEIVIDNIKFYNNINYDKYSCGNIHFINDLNITIKNSNFSNNHCKGNGEAMNKSIIRDEGFYKILIFSIGIGLYFISNFFITYTNYSGCLLNFLIKHTGISLLLSIYYIYNSLGDELGISGKDDSKFKTVSTFKSNDGIPSMDSDISSSIYSPSPIYPTKQNKYKLSRHMSPISPKNYRQSIRMFKSDGYVVIPDYQEIPISPNIETVKCMKIKNNNEINENNNNKSSDELITSPKNCGFDSNNNKSSDELITSPKNCGFDSNNNKSSDELITSPKNCGFNSNNNNPNFDINKPYNKPNHSLKINTNKDILQSSHINTCDTPDTNDNKKTKNEPLNKTKNYKNLKKSIKKAQSTFIEVHVIYPIYILITLLVSILMIINEKRRNIKGENIIQSRNGEWMYKCNNNNIDIIYHFLEFIVLLITLKKGLKILKYECVYKCTKFITYSSIIGIALGPLVNIIAILSLENQRYEKAIFETILNSICYLTFFILFSWNKVYYIIRNNEMDSNIYFKYVKHDKCTIHDSYTCACKFDDDDENDNYPIIKNYITFYKICSKIFEIDNGKIIYIDVKSKMTIIDKLYNKNTE